MFLRSLNAAMLGCALGLASLPALALGLGRLPQTVPLGQALDLQLPLRVAPGQTLSAACVQAEVRLGAQRLPMALLEVWLEPRGAAGEPMLRLRSARVVDEPLVAVQLTLGCAGEVSRQFTLLADPATAATAAPALRGAAVAAAAPPAAAVAAARGRRIRPVRPPHASTVPASLASAQPAAMRTAAASTTMATVAAVGAGEGTPVADAVVAAEERLRAMATALQTTREEAAAQSGVIDRLRQRLAQVENAVAPPAAWVAAVAALSLLVAGLAGRLRTLQRARRGSLADLPAAAAYTASPAAGWPSGTADRALPDHRALDGARATPAAASLPAQLPHDVTASRLAPPLAQDGAATSPIDDLIDLVQQAEFFAGLGDEQALVERLASQLRAGGERAGPMPYLLLRDVLRRRGDDDGCDRLRARYGARFDGATSAAPGDAPAARDLQDYPEVLARLQRVWAQPLVALDQLQRLLLAAPGEPLLSLPACRDALMLYLLARERAQLPHEAQLADQAAAVEVVDLLLPLAQHDDITPSIFDRLCQTEAGAQAAQVLRRAHPAAAPATGGAAARAR